MKRVVLLTALLALAGSLGGCGGGRANRFVWGRTPVWTPDGKRIIFSQNLSTPSDRVTNTVTTLDAGLIWGIDGTGANSTQITPTGRGPDFFPRVSPDGTMIAYACGESNQFDVYVMNLDGSNRRQITFDQAVDTTPAWSPDGRRVLFVSGRSGNYDIWSVGVDGSSLQQLTSFPSDEAAPCYSPDGTQIAFASNMDRGNFDIWLMDADGGNLRQVTRKNDSGSPLSDGGPAWTPDGKTLAFERWNNNWDIFTVRPDGSGLTQLTTDPGHDGDPQYSPDGQTIAFTSSRTGWWQVWLMGADGSNQRQLTGPK